MDVNLWIAEAEIGVVGIGYLILKCIRIRQRIFAVGDNRDIFHAITVKIGGDDRGGKFCRNGERLAKLLLHKCGELCGVARRTEALL